LRWTSFAPYSRQAFRASASTRPISLLAGFDFDILFGQLPATAVEEVLDGLALRVEPQPAAALPPSANPQVALGRAEACLPLLGVGWY
jgi:hypothetical protein